MRYLSSAKAISLLCSAITIVLIAFTFVACSSESNDETTDSASNTTTNQNAPTDTKSDGNNSFSTTKSYDPWSKIYFSDVDDNNLWYYSPIYYVTQFDLMTGYEENNLFGVGDPLTQGQLATALWRLAHFDDCENVNPDNNTVTKWIAENNVFSFPNTSDNKVVSDQNTAVTWEQLFYALANVLASEKALQLTENLELDDIVITDTVSPWAKPSVIWGIHSRLLDGYDIDTLGKIDASEIITREKAALVLGMSLIDLQSAGFDTYSLVLEDLNGMDETWNEIANAFDEDTRLYQNFLEWTYTIEFFVNPFVEKIEFKVPDSNEIFVAEQEEIDSTTLLFSLNIVSADDIRANGIDVFISAPSISNKKYSMHASFENKEFTPQIEGFE